MSRGIEISAATLARLRAAAAAQGLDTGSIAKRARLSPRLVRDVLEGRRASLPPRSLERLEYALAGGAPPPSRSWRQRPAAWVALLALTAAGGLAAWLVTHLRAQPEVELACESRTFCIRDARSGRVIRTITSPDRVRFAFIAPWKEASMVIYGTMNDTESGGRVHGLDLKSGEPLWSFGMPRADVAPHFPPDIANTGCFMPSGALVNEAGCERVCVADIDGDGSDDFVVKWIYEPWYPGCIAWYSLDPANPRRVRERGRYYTCGAILGAVTHDIDGDGRPGVIVLSTNNARGYQGAMLTFLDAAHWSGGSVDSVSVQSHWRNPPGLDDGSLARIVFPRFHQAVMRAFSLQRLDAAWVSVADDTLTVAVGLVGTPVATVRLDACLDVIDAQPTTEGRRMVLAFPETRDLVFNDDYVTGWARRRVRFGACLR